MLFGAAALVVVAAGIKVGAWVIAPAALTLVLVVLVSPIRKWLVARGLPGWFGALVIQLVLLGLLVGFALVLTASIAEIVSLARAYADEAADVRDTIAGALASAGVGGGGAHSLASYVDPSELAHALDAPTASINSLAGALFLPFGLLVFMAVDASGFSSRIGSVADARPAVARTLRSFATRTCRYLLVATVFGLAVALLDGIGLWLLGVPLAILWALLSFVTDYIPNIGFVLGLLPPALLGLLDGGLDTMVWVVALYSAVNFLLQVLLQSKIVGDAVDLSVTVSFLPVVVWAWLVGGLGAILAIPLTLLVKALLVDASPRTSWVAHLIDAGSGESPTGEPGRV